MIVYDIFVLIMLVKCMFYDINWHEGTIVLSNSQISMRFLHLILLLIICLIKFVPWLVGASIRSCST